MLACHHLREIVAGDELHYEKLSVAFGTDVDMTTTPLELTLKTDEFPRD